MWLFDPLVAAHRMQYKLSVELLEHPDPESHMVSCKRQIPRFVHPIELSRPAVVSVQYKTYRGALVVEDLSVEDLRPRTKTKALHLAIGGDKKGLLFRHIRTTKGLARVFPEGLEIRNRKDVLEIDAGYLCAVEE